MMKRLYITVLYWENNSHPPIEDRCIMTATQYDIYKKRLKEQASTIDIAKIVFDEGSLSREVWDPVLNED